MTQLPLSSAYRDAIVFALIGQLAAALVLLSLLDGGRLARVGAVAMIGFWLAVGWMIARRPRSPRTLDLLVVRWGFLPILCIAIAIQMLIVRT